MTSISRYCDKEIEFNKIKKCFKECFKKDINFEFFEWWFLKNPNTNKTYINYIEVDNELVSFYAVSPMKIIIHNQEYLIALSNMTMTSPNFRGKGLFESLANDLYKQLIKDEFIGVIGFANHNSHYGFRKKLNWIDLSILNNFTLEYNNDYQYNNINNQEYYILDSIITINHLEYIEKLIYSDKNITIKRENNYLKWRLFDNPINQYKSLIIEKNEIRYGIIIYKIKNNFLDIMEYFYNNENEKDEILINSIYYLSNKYKIKINIWSNINNFEHILLEKFGFRENNFMTYLGVIPFKLNNELINYENWHIRLIDYDNI